MLSIPIEPAAGSMIVGQRIRRPDALGKVKGSALYIEDIPVAGALLFKSTARYQP